MDLHKNTFDMLYFAQTMTEDLLLSFVEARVNEQYEHDLQHDNTHPEDVKFLTPLNCLLSIHSNCPESLP